MRHQHTITNPKTHHKPTMRAGKRSLLLEFIKFIALVIVVGLLLPPIACSLQQGEVTYD